ncbi:lipase family protein [Gardnerella vaginalis]|uniref:lipase family protein n=1 Tax=Gardnerella vaginalis TaxID=2702 RepID=UPI0007E41FA8|nr:lipase family protein [Gardnerella vaginalis]
MKKSFKLIGLSASLCLMLSMLSITTPAMAYTQNEHLTEAHTPLTEKTAKAISNGDIKLELPGALDMALYHKKPLDPNADLDGDGLTNRQEIYTYTKNSKTYYGYNSHPMMNDTDGDGIPDNQDSNPRRWDISPRDMTLFSELSYRDDSYINKVLDYTKPLHDIYKNRNEYRLMHNEIAPFWKAKETYHNRGGFDAVLFENVSPYPFLEQGTVQVLAIRGTSQFNDYDDDFAIAVGHNPDQAYDVEQLIERYGRENTVNNLYITGHSLGGYLAQRALIRADGKGYSWLKKIYTFNAPQIWGNIFNRWLRTAANAGNRLTREGYAVHYKVDNDRVIRSVGNFAGAISVGNSAEGHGSRSYFEPRMNNFPGFTVGTRGDISGTGRWMEELNNFYNVRTF